MVQWVFIFFEPLELTEENNNLPTYDIDPDSHFYNTLSMQFGRMCNYYSVDEFNEQLCACNELKTKPLLSLCHINDRSAVQNLHEFEIYFHFLSCQ